MRDLVLVSACFVTLCGGAGLGVPLHASGPCPVPVNDTCESAVPLVLGETQYCTTAASTELLTVLPAPLCGVLDLTIVKDIWFSYVPPGDGTLTLSTCGQAAFDTAMAVWGSAVPGEVACPTGEGDSAVLVGCNDDACFLFRSKIEVDLVGGESYRIQLGSLAGQGLVTLAATFTSVGASCDLPRVIPSNTEVAVYSGTTEDNPIGFPSLDICGVGSAPAEWFSWTAPCEGPVTVSTCLPGTDFDTTLHVYLESAAGVCDDTLVDCIDDITEDACQLPDGNFHKSRVEFVAEGGKTYHIRVGGFDRASGSYELLFSKECRACSCVGKLTPGVAVDGGDLGVLLSAWGLNSGPADLDGSGMVDGADLGILLSAWGPCPAPANDLCASALPLVLGDTLFCTRYATTEPPTTTCGAFVTRDIWFSHVPTEDGRLTLSLCGQAPFDTALIVWGNAVPGVAACPSDGSAMAVMLGCNDDGCGFQSLLEVDLTGGEAYRIQLGGLAGDAGSGTLTSTFTPAGSTCLVPRVIPSETNFALYPGTTADNPVALPEYVPGCFTGYSREEWFSWTAPCDANVVVSTCRPDTDYDTTIHVYQESDALGCEGVLVTCNNDTVDVACELPGGFAYKSRVVFFATSGETYNIRIGGFDAAFGSFEVLFAKECVSE